MAPRITKRILLDHLQTMHADLSRKIMEVQEQLIDLGHELEGSFENASLHRIALQENRKKTMFA